MLTITYFNGAEGMYQYRPAWQTWRYKKRACNNLKAFFYLPFGNEKCASLGSEFWRVESTVTKTK